MAIEFKQLLSNQITSENLLVAIGAAQTENSSIYIGSNNIIFTDTVYAADVFVPGQNYYLDFDAMFDIPATESASIRNKQYKIELFLYNGAIKNPTKKKTISTFYLGAGVDNAEHKMLTFYCNGQYQKLGFLIANRETLDDWRAPLTVTVNTCEVLTNILTDVMLRNEIQKIGLQGNPGQLFCINNECITIGKGFTYEPLEDLVITFIGVPNSEKRADRIDYIIDYQVEKEA